MASGGDTLWSNQFLAYEGLSEPIRALIDGLTALHGRPAQTGTTTHPMVKSHPVNNRGRLSVNRGWTRAVASLSETDSRPLLAMLFERNEHAEYQICWRWTAGDAALWDNRCTMHYSVDDDAGERSAARWATIYDD